MINITLFKERKTNEIKHDMKSKREGESSLLEGGARRTLGVKMLMPRHSIYTRGLETKH